MNLLLQCVQQLQPNYQLLAANLLLQLDVLVSTATWELKSHMILYLSISHALSLKKFGSLYIELVNYNRISITTWYD